MAPIRLLLLSVLLAAATGAQAPQAKAPAEGWVDALLAARQAVRAKAVTGLTLGPWHATAPLPAASLDVACFPEKGVDLQARDEKGRPRWRRRERYRDGKVHQLPARAKSATYLYREIRSAASLTVTAGLGSDDGFALWLNGKRLRSRNVARGAAANQDLVDLPLRRGVNKLLFKIHNGAGAHAFFFSLDGGVARGAWRDLVQRFPRESRWLLRDRPKGRHMAWFRVADGHRFATALAVDLLAELGLGKGTPTGNARVARISRPDLTLRQRLAHYHHLCRVRQARADLAALNLPALRLAVEHLAKRHGNDYPVERMKEALAAAAGLREVLDRHLALGSLPAAVPTGLAALRRLRREALLANPLLKDLRVLLVQRRRTHGSLGLPQNWQGNCSLPRQGWDDTLVAWEATTNSLTPVYKPAKPGFIGDVDLHWEGKRLLFSAIGSHKRWQIFEVGVDGTGLRQVTPGRYKDVDNYDACYLPDDRIVFDSTRCFQGIPCVGGADQVANLFLMEPSGRVVRQLCFDQDHDWCPTVMNDGRVLYTRWEYSDTPHYFSRLLFRMNPDGTEQVEVYGSNSFWPNSLFYARPLPGHPSKLVAVVSGHHGVRRQGELVILDPAQGRREADGVVQRLPGRGRSVPPVIKDRLVDDVWPRFLHPWPLDGDFFLVACQPARGSLWGLYLVDTFDNLLLLKELEGHALFEPTPLRPRPRPPVIPDRVRPESRDATVYLHDIYRGPGLAGVPRGTVKRLRLYEFHYAYNRMGGHAHVGVEGPWDVRRILGTVPVHPDGSAAFVVPANTPIALQPLDGEGKALQVMRSWFTAMPGETLSCVGCHESQNSAPPAGASTAGRRPPTTITPWHGPARGFSFKREVQPVLDRYCIRCHGVDHKLNLLPRRIPGWRGFTPSYLALHPYVRRPGPESDYHLQRPLEFHASTSELVQMLRKGHQGVRLEPEAWDRLITWIDLNVPDHGTWGEHSKVPGDLVARRLAMRTRYANRPENPEKVVPGTPYDVTPVAPDRARPLPPPPPAPAGWPPAAGELGRRLAATGLAPTRRLDLGGGVHMDFVLVPPGRYRMGSLHGAADERPLAVVNLEAPFYLSKTEVTRAQYNRFDPGHHNGYLNQRHKDHTRPGYGANRPDHPVIRVSWQRARACALWLGRRAGVRADLPTEAEWEWACRAGTERPFHWGGVESDFSPFANLADRSVRRLAVTGIDPKPMANPNRWQDWLPAVRRFDDGQRIMATVGRYRANPLGLHDMHGNVAEWTRSLYRPYPYRAGDGREAAEAKGRRVARGGSWRDRAHRATASYRLPYQPWQGVFNVGFRVALYPGVKGEAPR